MIPASISFPVDAGYRERELSRVSTAFYETGSRTHEEAGGRHVFQFRLNSWLQVPTFLDFTLAAAAQLGLSEITIEMAGIPERLTVT